MTKITTTTTQTAPVNQEDIERLACQLDDLICAADEAGQDRLSALLNAACDALEGAIDDAAIRAEILADLQASADVEADLKA